MPQGNYLLRPVKLLSHTELVILPGATLVAWSGVGWKNGWPNSTTRNCSANPYQAKDVLVPRLESLLYGDAVKNVTIRGGGIIDGQVDHIHRMFINPPKTCSTPLLFCVLGLALVASPW